MRGDMSEPEHPKTPPTLEADAQCPNCGSYGAQAWVFWRERATGELVEVQPQVETRAIVLVFIISGLALGLASNFVANAWAPWVGLIGGAIVALAFVGVHTWRGVRRELASVRVRRYKCRRCLHLWDWAEGRPQPRYRATQEIWDDYRALFGEPPQRTRPTSIDKE